MNESVVAQASTTFFDTPEIQFFFLIGLCPGLLKQREGHQRHLTLCGDATVSLSFSELTCWSPIPTLSSPRYQRKG